MRNHSKVVLFATLVCAALFTTTTFAATPTLTLINQGDSPMTDVAYAPTGTDRWFSMAGGAVEMGGKVVVAMPASACVFDVRFRFKDEVTVTVKAWDVCKNPVIEIGRKST